MTSPAPVRTGETLLSPGTQSISSSNGQRSHAGKYPISSVLLDPNSTASLFPSFPSLSANPYIPSSISSLSTSFTSSGTLPRAAANSKQVAQRRSQAPPLVVSDTRRVLRSEFDAYLQEVGPEWERWDRERRLGRRGTADLGNQMEERRGSLKLGLGLGVDDDEEDGPILQEEEHLPPLDGVPRIFFDTDFNLSNPRTFDLVTEKILLTPHTSPVLTRTSLSRPPRTQGHSLTPLPGLGPLTLAELASDQVLQEKLSHYTAVVESHLVREIGVRSSSFFSALSNLQDLHSQGEHCLAKIGELQTALAADQTIEGVQGSGVGGVAKRGLGILREQARRRGLEKIDNGMQEVEEVWSGVEAVRELVENGEWMEALAVAEQVESIYYGRTDAEDSSNPLPSTSRINLQKVKALDSTPTRLAALRVQVAKSLEIEMMGVLDREMELGVEEYMKSVTKGNWKGKGKAVTSSLSLSIISEEEAMGEDLGVDRVRERARERVRPVVQGLVRADGMDGAIAVWREAVLRDVRSMVREHLPTPDQPLDDDDLGKATGLDSVMSEKSINLAKNLRALTHTAFLLLARDTYSGLLGCIEVVDIHSKVLLELVVVSRNRNSSQLHPDSATSPVSDAISSLSPNSLLVPADLLDDRPSPPQKSDSKLPLLPNSDNLSLASDLADVVHAAAELANLRFSKVMAVRSEVHSTLTLPEFLEIFDVTWSFVLECEVICRRMIVGLRGVMVGQAKGFLQTFHQKRITEGARMVENEQWVVAEVSGEVQEVVDLVLKSAVTNPPAFLLGARVKVQSNGNVPAIEEAGDAAKKLAKQVDIDGTGYFAVAAGLHALEVLGEYLKVVMNCPLLTTDAMSKVIEYMKVFNSRTCQVVLGAGAMRSAGLKNITAKHLALASQALSIMISLIPYIRETLRRHLNPKQAVMLVEFDKLKRDYQEHQNEIHSKLVAIMSDRLQVHCKTLQSIDWETAVVGRTSDLPNLYMESLVKEHVTLHKVLSRFLSPSTVEFIMLQVVVALNQRLVEEFGSVAIKSEEARERMLGDAVYLKVKLSELKGLEKGSPGDGLGVLITAKQLPQAPPPPPPPSAPQATPTKERASFEAIRSTPRPYLSRRAESTSSPARSAPPSVAPSPERPSTPSLVITQPTLEPTPEVEAEAIVSPSPATPIKSPIISPTPQSIPLPPSPAIEQVPTFPPPSNNPVPQATATLIAPVPVEPPKRRSMAERLSEIARRGSGDLPPPLTSTPTVIKFAPLPPPPEEEVEVVVEVPVVVPEVAEEVSEAISTEEIKVESEPIVEATAPGVEPTLAEAEQEVEKPAVVVEEAVVEEIEEEESSFV